MVELREVHKQCEHKGSSSGPRVSVGNVLIIHDDNQRREMWSFGQGEELLVGNDGEVREAVLRMAGLGQKAKQIRRAFQRLYPLEMPAQDKQTKTSPELYQPPGRAR